MSSFIKLPQKLMDTELPTLGLAYYGLYAALFTSISTRNNVLKCALTQYAEELDLPYHTLRRMIQKMVDAKLITRSRATNSVRITFLTEAKKPWIRFLVNTTLLKAWKKSIEHKGLIFYLLLTMHFGVVGGEITEIANDVGISRSRLQELLEDLSSNDIVDYSIRDSILTVIVKISHDYSRAKQVSNTSRSGVTSISIDPNRANLNCEQISWGTLTKRFCEAMYKKKMAFKPSNENVFRTFINSGLSLEEVNDGIAHFENNKLHEVWNAETLCAFLKRDKKEDDKESIQPQKNPLAVVQEFLDLGDIVSLQRAKMILEGNYSDGFITDDDYVKFAAEIDKKMQQ